MVTNPIQFVSVKCFDDERDYKILNLKNENEKLGKIATWSIIMNVVLIISILILTFKGLI